MIRLLVAFLLTYTALSPATAPDLQPKTSTFSSIDVYLDPHDHPLAAYQIEITTPSNVTLVGLEAGDPAAFARTPPYYDPAAMGHNRIILAAFTTDPNLPRSRCRIAKLHLMAENPPDNAPIHYGAKLLVAADADGKAINGAAVSVQ